MKGIKYILKKKKEKSERSVSHWPCATTSRSTAQIPQAAACQDAQVKHLKSAPASFVVLPDWRHPDGRPGTMGRLDEHPPRAVRSRCFRFDCPLFPEKNRHRARYLIAARRQRRTVRHLASLTSFSFHCSPFSSETNARCRKQMRTARFRRRVRLPTLGAVFTGRRARTKRCQSEARAWQVTWQFFFSKKKRNPRQMDATVDEARNEKPFGSCLFI